MKALISKLFGLKVFAKSTKIRGYYSHGSLDHGNVWWKA
jgi:hypothetical protein